MEVRQSPRELREASRKSARPCSRIAQLCCKPRGHAQLAQPDSMIFRLFILVSLPVFGRGLLLDSFEGQLGLN